MTKLQTLVQAAFSEDDLIEALTEQVTEYIDYDYIAQQLLETCRHEINEAAQEIACDLLY